MGCFHSASPYKETAAMGPGVGNQLTFSGPVAPCCRTSAWPLGWLDDSCSRYPLACSDRRKLHTMLEWMDRRVGEEGLLFPRATRWSAKNVRGPPRLQCDDQWPLMARVHQYERLRVGLAFLLTRRRTAWRGSRGLPCLRYAPTTTYRANIIFDSYCQSILLMSLE